MLFRSEEKSFILQSQKIIKKLKITGDYIYTAFRTEKKLTAPPDGDFRVSKCNIMYVLNVDQGLAQAKLMWQLETDNKEEFFMWKKSDIPRPLHLLFLDTQHVQESPSAANFTMFLKSLLVEHLQVKSAPPDGSSSYFVELGYETEESLLGKSLFDLEEGQGGPKIYLK